MIPIDWTSALLGGGVGAVMSVLFFAGLAVGMRFALRSTKPVGFLALSSALRISALIGVGWIVAEHSGPWAALGYAIVFFAARLVATSVARIGAAPKAAL